MPVTFVPKLHILHPGDVACAERGDQVETLLGSCVAIVLTDPRHTIAVMCHFVHSRSASGCRATDCQYADVALSTMYALLYDRGINPLLCVAYVYGGSNMFSQIYQAPHVGESNLRWALAALAEDGIKVLAEEVGGTCYRRVKWTVGHQLPQVIAVDTYLPEAKKIGVPW
jgi:chemotaxis protein CheD